VGRERRARPADLHPLPAPLPYLPCRGMGGGLQEAPHEPSRRSHAGGGGPGGGRRAGGYTFLYARGYSYLTDAPGACADCHMPYMRVGALKVSDHHVRSPVLNLNRACQSCHGWPEEELKARVEETQGRVFALRSVALEALVDLISDLQQADESGAAPAGLERACDYQRRAQLYLNFVVPEN
jgi:hypothetical protein